MVKQLFDLEENQLACIADGTYLYAEKSASNSLQLNEINLQTKYLITFCQIPYFTI
jgi:hypothetical protein